MHAHPVLTPLSPWMRVLPAGARCSGQGDTDCAGSLQSLKERCIRNWLPASPAPTVFLRCVILQPTSEDVGEALPAAGGGNWELSSEAQWLVGATAWFIGFSESILNWEKICCNALMGIFTHLYYWICAGDCNITSNVCYLIDWCVSTCHRVKMWLSMNSRLNFWLRDTVGFFLSASWNSLVKVFFHRVQMFLYVILSGEPIIISFIITAFQTINKM